MDSEEAKSKLEKAVDFFEVEVRKLRGGRVTPAILEGVMVEAYGQMSPISHVGTVTVVDANLLSVSVWDKSLVEAVKKAIESSDMGINPQVDGDMVKIPIPPMSTERRQEIVKILNEKEEEAKIVIRQIRKDYISKVDRDLKEKIISEDEAKRGEKQMQDLVEESNRRIEEITKRKEEELMKV